MTRIRKIRRVKRPNGSQVGIGVPQPSLSAAETPVVATTSVLVVAPTAFRTVFVSRMVTFEGVSLAGVAETESQALERAVKDRPDVAVIDMDVCGPLTGLHLARTIQKVAPKTGILVVVKTLAGIDLRAEARSFGSSWSYMWRGMVEEGPSTEAVLRAVGCGVHWVDPQLKRILQKVWSIATQARDLERESLRELAQREDLEYRSPNRQGAGGGIQSVSVGDGGRGQRFSGWNSVRRVS